MAKRTGILGIAVVAAALVAMPAWPCSICRCGDPTFNALGKDGVALSGLRLALDWDQLEKTQGDPSEGVDSMRERRATLLLAYGFSDRFSLLGRVSYAERDLTESQGGEVERTRARGLADPEIYGQLRLWSSSFSGDVGVRSSVYAVLGLKTPWGENNVSRNGERLDEHAQPGTGSTDWFGGIAGSYQISPRSALFFSTQYRLTGRNDSGYRYGRVTLLNAAYERKLTARWDTVLEANHRRAGSDQISSSLEKDTDTGGKITYLTPRLLFDAGNGWVLRASAQVPLSQSGLNGHQHERMVVNFGVTRFVGR